PFIHIIISIISSHLLKSAYLKRTERAKWISQEHSTHMPAAATALAFQGLLTVTLCMFWLWPDCRVDFKSVRRNSPSYESLATTHRHTLAREKTERTAERTRVYLSIKMGCRRTKLYESRAEGVSLSSMKGANLEGAARIQ